ncbi:nitrous oxide reductase accessory protein NosL [bacterium]|nr:nitrous oxide reductase accessory protein NosL [bacterium]
MDKLPESRTPELPPPGEQHATEPELYLEPAEMRASDSIGVVIALLALLVIGYSGYVWLNPDLSSANAFAWIKGGAASDTEQVTAVTHEHTEAQTAEDGAAETPAAVERHSCEYCGMYTDISSTQVIASWTDGSESRHDCWDCTFGWGRQQGLSLEKASVLDYSTFPAAPEWLDAAQAWYLYDTSKLAGSMPPYIAAFADKAAAEKAMPELGGRLLDWEGLQARMQQAQQDV